MRKIGLGIGALALATGLTFGVMTSTSAQDLSDPAVFGPEFLACAAVYGISPATEEVLENLGLEPEEGTFVDLTPYNPVDEGSIVFVEDVDCFAAE